MPARAFVLLARGLLLLIGMLVFWSAAPTVLGLRGDVVMSGSMSPALRPGDVVLTQRAPAGRIRTGDIVLVRNPARPGTTLVHRAVGTTADGALLTKGDANAMTDSTPVPASMVIGLPRLRVPYVALPAVWWSVRDYSALVPVAVAMVVLTLVAAGRAGGPAVPVAAVPPYRACHRRGRGGAHRAAG